MSQKTFKNQTFSKTLNSDSNIPSLPAPIDALHLTAPNLTIKNLELKLADNSPTILGPLSFQILPHQFVAIITDYDTPINSLFEILMGYLSPSKGSIQANYELTEEQIRLVNSKDKLNISNGRLDINLEKMTKINFRSQIFYSEPTYPIFSASIKENIFPMLTKMKENSYMKLYEFLIKYKFEDENLKNKGFEARLENSCITNNDRKLMCLCSLMMTNKNLILLDRVEHKMDETLQMAFDEIMDELSPLENPRKNMVQNSVFLDQEFTSSLVDPQTGHISEIDQKRIKNRQKRRQFNRTNARNKPTLLHFVLEPKTALNGFYDRILVFKQGKLVDDIWLNIWERKMQPGSKGLTMEGSFWNSLDDQGKEYVKKFIK